MDEFLTKVLTVLVLLAALLFASRADAQQAGGNFAEQALSARLLREINESLDKDRAILTLQAQIKDLQGRIEKAKTETEKKPE